MTDYHFIAVMTYGKEKHGDNSYFKLGRGAGADVLRWSKRATRYCSSAIFAGEYLFKLLNRLPVPTFLTYVDTEALSMRSEAITEDNLRAQIANIK